MRVIFFKLLRGIMHKMKSLFKNAAIYRCCSTMKSSSKKNWFYIMKNIWLTLMTALQIFSCLPLIFFTYSNVRNFTFVFNNKLHKLSFFIHIFSTVLCKSPYSVWIQDNIMSAIRQTGKSQNGCYKKTKRTKFSRKEHFLPSDTHTYVCVTAGKKCSFFGKFGVVWDSSFGQSSSSQGPPCCRSFSKHTENLYSPLIINLEHVVHILFFIVFWADFKLIVTW